MPTPSPYRIVSVEGGGWMIVTDEGQPVLGNQDYPNPQVARDALAELGRGEDDRVSLVLWPELYDFISNLARDMGATRGDVLRKATGLLRMAVDAKDQGKKLVIVDDVTGDEEEITGI